ncbi:hypothetical protein H072_1246 [Dactylellina haptotyla CBS 200.50]|uniref:Myb-like domain-containing protein n=1 Tax=Dactylellina haptotyla (strain CBS 200.50) TaxID=1284197 RepID=S8BZ11_DACHA|nr:hypothetical protein H072_1246 [Dactylellina haptotyla CBS 200.50]
MESEPVNPWVENDDKDNTLSEREEEPPIPAKQGKESEQDTDMDEPDLDAENDENEANVTTEDAVTREKGGKAAKKASGKTKGRPKGNKADKPKKGSVSKKRKRANDAEDSKDEKDDTKKEATESANGEGEKAPAKRGRGRGSNQEAWNADTEKLLTDIIKERTNNHTTGINWNLILEDYKKAVPGTQRKVRSLQNRWFNLKTDSVELSQEQEEYFKQAVKEINGSEKNAAIAWRYKQLSNSEISKGVVAKLLKNLSLN